LLYSHRGFKSSPHLRSYTSCSPPCMCALKYSLRPKDSSFPGYFYLAWQCLICPAAPKHQRWVGAALRARSSAVLRRPSVQLATSQTAQRFEGRSERSSRGFLSSLFHAKPGKESLAFSVTLPIPFARCLKAKYPPNFSLTSVSCGRWKKKIPEGIYLSKQIRLRDNKTKGELQYFYIRGR